MAFIFTRNPLEKMTLVQGFGGDITGGALPLPGGGTGGLNLKKKLSKLLGLLPNRDSVTETLGRNHKGSSKFATDQAQTKVESRLANGTVKHPAPIELLARLHVYLFPLPLNVVRGAKERVVQVFGAGEKFKSQEFSSATLVGVGLRHGFQGQPVPVSVPPSLDTASATPLTSVFGNRLPATALLHMEIS